MEENRNRNIERFRSHTMRPLRWETDEQCIEVMRMEVIDLVFRNRNNPSKSVLCYD